MLRILCNPIMLPVAFNGTPSPLLSTCAPFCRTLALPPFHFLSPTLLSLFLAISVRHWWTSWLSCVAISNWIRLCTPWSCSHLRATPWHSSPTLSWAPWMWPVSSLRRKCWRRKWCAGPHPNYQRSVRMETAWWCYFQMMETHLCNIQNI